MIDSEKVLRQFLEVTAIPGISRRERQIIDYIKDFLEKLGFAYYEDTAHQSFGGDAGNVICKITNAKTPSATYLLAAHVDTVSLSCEKPIVKNKRIISSDDRILGADDRVGVVVLLEALKLIARKAITYPNLEVVFLVAEEVGLLGSSHLEYSKITATEAFNFDCSAPVGHVVQEAPAKVDFEMRFIGREAHSAVAPEKGINAINMASNAVSKLELPQKNGDTIFNIGSIKGGTENNIIPGKVEVTGEIRSFSMKTIAQYLDNVQSTALSEAKRHGGSFEFEHQVSYRSFKLDDSSSVFKIAKAAIQEVNEQFVPIRFLGGSDANIFNHKNLKAVNIGLGYVNNHSPGEYIEVSNLVRDVEIGSKIVEIAAKFQN